MIEIIKSDDKVSFVNCVFDPFTIDPDAVKTEWDQMKMHAEKKSCKGTA